VKKTVSLYDPKTGFFTGQTVSCREDRIAQNVPSGLAAKEGTFDHRSQRVDVTSGQVVSYERPASALEAERRAAQVRDARQRIAALERSQLRPMRELAIDPNNVEAKRRLQEIETEIAGLRPQ